MPRSSFAALSTLLFLLLGTASTRAIDYDVPEPEQRFGGSGWLIASGSDHGIRFKTYLESKQLIIKDDGIYYRGTQRVEGIDGNPHGIIRWHYLARCAVPPSRQTAVKIGLWVSNSATELSNNSENFMEIDLQDVTPSNVMKGWYSLWWSACRNQARSFSG